MSRQRFIYSPHPEGPHVSHWVWVTGYIDFKRGQRELCRVMRGSFPNQLVLGGHWRGGEWAMTAVELELYPYDGHPSAQLFDIKRIGFEPISTTVPVWEAHWHPVLAKKGDIKG